MVHSSAGASSDSTKVNEIGSNPPASISRVCVVLIHGVGSSQAKVLQKSVDSFLKTSGINRAEVREYHWNSLVNQPFTKEDSSKLDSSYVGGVIRAIQNSALEPSGNRSSLIHFLTVSIQYLVALLPIFLLWKAALLLSATSPMPGFSFRHPIGSWMLASDLILSNYFQIPAIVRGSGPMFWIVTLSWLKLMAGIGGLSLLCAATSIASLKDQLRRLLLLGSSPLVGSAVLLFTVSLPLVLIMYGAVLAILAMPYVFDISVKALIAVVLGMFVPTLIGVFALTWTVERVVGPFVKVVADVFRYLSDFSYREKLDRGLRQALSELKLGSDTVVIVVGHSLGSVIAAHFLVRNCDFLPKLGSLRLITLGSPLLRYFHRFFPEFCPHPETIFRVIAEQKPDFQWVNIYRPWDPIGASFGHRPGVRDLSTKQWWKIWLGGHTDYWTDLRVLKIIQLELMTAAMGNDCVEHATDSDPGQDLWFGQFPDRGIPRVFLNWLALATTVCILIWMYSSTLHVKHSRREAQQELVRRIDHDYVEVVGAVSVKRTDLVNPLDTSDWHPVCSYVVTYGVQDSGTPAISRHFGDMRDCDATPPSNVVVRYNRAHPVEFYVVSEKDDSGNRGLALPFLIIYATPIIGLLTFFTSRSALRVCLGIGGNVASDPLSN